MTEATHGRKDLFFRCNYYEGYSGGSDSRIPGTGSLVGCHLWGRTESDMTEVTQQQQQQTVKNLLMMLETWVQSLSQEDPLEKETATHSRYSCLENAPQRSNTFS